MADQRPPLSSFVKTERPPLSSFVKQPDDSNIFSKISQFVAPATTKLGSMLGVGASMISPDFKQAQESQKRLDQANAKVMQRIAKEKDPVKKAQLQRVVRQGIDASTQISQDLATGQQQATGLTQEQFQRSPAEYAARTGVGVGAELASFLVPPGAKEVGMANRVVQATGTGAKVGGLTGISKAAQEAETLGEAASTITGQTATGAVAGATLQTGIEGLKLASKVPQKAGKWVVDKVTQQAKDDVINKLNPNRAIRETALKRNIDIGDEFFKSYSDDVIKNLEISNRKVAESATKLENILKNNQAQFNSNEVVDSILAEQSKNIRTPAQQQALQSWADFTKKNIAEKYGSSTINSTAALAEKRLAGQSGYKATSDVVDSFIGQADAKLEQKLREKILGSVSGAEKIRLEKLLRDQEVNIFMGNIMENLAIGKVPRSTAQKLGSLFFPTSLARQTAGQAIQYGVSKVPQPVQTTQNIFEQIQATPVKESGIKPSKLINPAVQALQRMIDKENQSKQTNKKLP